MALGKNMKVDRLIPDVKSELNEEVISIVVEQIQEIKDTVLVEEAKAVVVEKTVEAIVEEVKAPVSEFQIKDIDTDDLKVYFSPSKRKTQKRIIVNIEGNLTVLHIEDLKSKIDEIFTLFDYVEVNIKNVTQIDLTAVQLFHLMRAIYHSKQKYTSINAEFSREDRKMLNACGFTEFQTQVKAS